VAKSSKRRKQDQAKAVHKRAEQARRKVNSEQVKQARQTLQRLFDPQTPPGEVAPLIMQIVADQIHLAAQVASKRLEAGAEPQDMAETSRLVLASCPPEPPVGVLAFAAIAAHADGQEEEARRHTARLLDAARTNGDDSDGDRDGRWLDVLEYVIAPWHPDEAAKYIEPYLAEHPADFRPHRIYARVVSAVYEKSSASERAADDLLARFADRAALSATREALEAFATGTPWQQRVSEAVTEQLDSVPGEEWSDMDRAGFSTLMSEIALFNAEDTEDDEDDEVQGSAVAAEEPIGPVRETLLAAFAADPQTPAVLARRARDWDKCALYGLWQMESATAGPGVWVRELATGVSRYAEFPPDALAEAPPWTTWLGCLLPVDGIWRWTGAGLPLSPAEADAVGEYVESAIEVLAVSLAGNSTANIPGKPPFRFGQAEPFGVMSEFETELEPEQAAFVSNVVAAVLAESAVAVLRYRAAPPRLQNTDGDEMVLIEADIAVSGNVSELLLAHPDFQPNDDPSSPHPAAATKITWLGHSVPAGPRDALSAEFRTRLSVAGPLDLPEDQRWARGALAVSDGLVRASLNSRKRLERLLRILSRLGADPVVAAQTHADPAQHRVLGGTAQLLAPGGQAGVATESWAKAWLDASVAALEGLTPREAADSDDRMDVYRLESLLRQFEYESSLAASAGLAPMDIAWLRAELDMEEALESFGW
jgi:hypothetical protein